MKSKKPGPERSRNGFFVPVLLAVVLAVLFWRSFLPDYVHFFNDAPLGVQNSAWIHIPQAFTGAWYDLNSIGSNGGEASLDAVTLIRWAFDPVICTKVLTPVALWILGMSAWFFFRRSGLAPLASVLGGLAAMLASTFFSDACWGVVSHEIALGMDFCALGLFAANSPQTPALVRWARLALAGLAVGVNVVEAADIGAILSVFVALFVFFKSLTEENGAIVLKIGRGIARVTIIAVFAGFISAQTVITLVGTSITGISGTGQDAASKLKQWDGDTQWSLPKKETLGLFVPGLFGYRMDTPKDMMPDLLGIIPLPDYKGGNYWGGIGRTPVLDRYFDGGRQGPAPSGPGIIMRFSGTGEYVGILVALIAMWAIAQSFRRQNSVFTPPQRKFIRFGAIVLAGSLLLTWGRFAPFYQFVYMLPYASTIRNPAKFIVIFSWVILILFGYGVHGLGKLYLQPSPASPAQSKNWWAKIRGFDRYWAQFSIAAVICSVLAWLVFVSEKAQFIDYLKIVGFPQEFAREIAGFSIGQAGWFILFFALSAGLVILVIAGVFSGRRARLGGILLGALLVLDLGRANLPWIIHWDYKQKYEIGTLNPVIKDFLLKEPYEHRVAQLPSPPGYELFGQLYGIEWIQHLFPYYNIQSLDKVQQPREPVDQEAFERTLMPNPLRFWQLTNTRYLLGAAGFIEAFDNQLDPEQKRFRIAARFNIVPKPDVEVPYGISPEQYVNYLQPDKQTAQISPDGQYALFDFTGALPRAKLYTDWQTNSAAELSGFTTNGLSAEDLYVLNEAGTNGFLTLKKLASPSFDPEKTVLLDSPLPVANFTGATNQDSVPVEFKSYAPKDIVLSADAVVPSILLLNDKFDPNWSVTVDGKPAIIFHANFIMRGVYLAPGAHTVEFRFALPNGLFYVTLAATAVGILLIGFLIFWQRKSQSSEKNNRK